MCRVLVASAVVALAFPQLAMAEDSVEEQLRLMNERMSQLEDQLQAAQDDLDDSRGTIERQQELIEKAEIGEEGKSGLDDFFTSIEVGGWVATSWFYNFNNPRDTNRNANTGSTAGLAGQTGQDPVFEPVFGPLLGGDRETGWAYPLRPDHNTFQVDQVWFEIEKPVTEESRAGFRLDMVYGKTAAQLSGDTTNRRNGLDSASAFNLYQAYVQYLLPWGNMTVKAGKFQTIAGYEVIGTVYNNNVTIGNVFALLQPVNHLGILIDGEWGVFNWKLGAVNDAGCSLSCAGTDPDENDAKSLVAGAGVAYETFAANINILWGVDDEQFSDGLFQTGDSGFGESGLLDVVLAWDPTERISTAINFDYKWFPGYAGGNDPDAWGIAMYARLGILDNLGFSLRGEYLQDSSEVGLLGDSIFGFADGDGTDIGSITGTLDWTITDGLVAKAEIRWDSVTISDGSDTTVFINDNKDATRFTRSDQLVGGVELSYQF